MTFWIVATCLFAFLTGLYWQAHRYRKAEVEELRGAITRLVEENRLLRRGSRP